MGTDDTSWQDDWPEHTEAIDEAVEALVRAINRLAIDAGLDHWIQAAALEYSVEQLRSFLQDQINDEIAIALGLPPDDKGNDDDPT